MLGKVIPNLENLEAVEEYLESLGRRHAIRGVRIEHLDLLSLVYCSAVRAVVANQGKTNKCEQYIVSIEFYIKVIIVSFQPCDNINKQICILLIYRCSWRPTV